jgi:hypothetical protein
MGVFVCGLLCIGILSTLQGTTVNATASQFAFDQSSPPMIAAPEEARSSVEPVISQISAVNEFSVRAEKASYTPRR